MKTIKTKVHKGTWLGVAGISTTYHLDSRSDGLRVSVLELEGKPVEAKLIEGDGRTDKFVVHSAGEL